MGGRSSKATDAAKVIDGKSIAAAIRGEITTEVSALKAKYGKVPGLAVVIVGARPDSATYVRMKRKACDEAGIVSFHKELPDTATEAEVLKIVSEFNANADCHGEERTAARVCGPGPGSPMAAMVLREGSLRVAKSTYPGSAHI
jgi:hypothetical protein